MGSRIDMVGRRFGRLVVIAEDTSNKSKRVYWLCLCDCGNTKSIDGSKLRNGNTRSCRCLDTEMTKARSTTHGRARTPIYNIWKGIHRRCNSPQDKAYPYYGGRGIKVCERWGKFENFLTDMGERPTNKHQIDRVNNDGNYSPENCRWALQIEQANNKRNNFRITHRGVTKTLHEWSREIGVGAPTIRARLERYDWNIEKALSPENKPDHSKNTGHKYIIASRHGKKNYRVQVPRDGKQVETGRYYTLDEAIAARDSLLIKRSLAVCR